MEDIILIFILLIFYLGQCRQDIDCNRLFPDTADQTGYVHRAICKENICGCADGQELHGFVCLGKW